MNKYVIYTFSMLFMLLIMSSCEIMLEIGKSIVPISKEFYAAVDNADRETLRKYMEDHPEEDSINYKGVQPYLLRTGELNGLIMASEAINSGKGGQALVGMKIASNLIGTITNTDVSTFNQIMDNSINSMLADKNSASPNDNTNLIGAFSHLGEELANFTKDTVLKKHNAELEEDANSNPYFDCFYEIVTDSITGRKDICMSRGSKEFVLDCIREKQANQMEQRFSQYMQDNYGKEMTYKEYLSLPNSDRPNIENCIFPERTNIQDTVQWINDFMDYADVPSEQKNQERDILSETQEQVYYTNELETLEQTRVDGFKCNIFQLSNDNKIRLDQVAEILHKNSGIKIELLGHSCNLGTEDVCYVYGILRAKQAKQYLIDHGIDGKRISVQSMGSKRPLLPNTSEENRAKNRRVEVIVIK